MAPTGKLEKMLILAFSDSKKAENGGVAEADDSFEALINPETYTLDYKLKFSESGQGHGTSGKQLKYEYTEPAEMSFEFLFDNTGIIDGEPRDSIADDLKKFKQVLIDYKGDSHEPRHFKLVWGENSIFKGRVTEVGITYKLFNSDGTPIRAIAKVTFKSSIEEEKRAAKENKKSPGPDACPQGQARRYAAAALLSRSTAIPRYYLQVAERNGLANFRQLKPGDNLSFPPIAKTTRDPVSNASTIPTPATPDVCTMGILVDGQEISGEFHVLSVVRQSRTQPDSLGLDPDRGRRGIEGDIRGQQFRSFPSRQDDRDPTRLPLAERDGVQGTDRQAASRCARAAAY